MTYDIEPNAPAEAIDRAREFHEYAVNQMGLSTYDVLFIAHDDGTVTGRVGLDVARDSSKDDLDFDHGSDHFDPDPPGIGVNATTASSKGTDAGSATSDTADA